MRRWVETDHTFPSYTSKIYKMALTLKQLSDFILNQIEESPELADKNMWTMSEGNTLAMKSVTTSEDGNKRILINWTPFNEDTPLWTVRIFSEGLLSILQMYPDLQFEHVWSQTHQFILITEDYIQDADITRCDFILPSV